MGFLLPIAFVAIVFLMFMLLSKATNSNISYKGNAETFKPDDLGNIYNASRRLVDKKFEGKNEARKRLITEYRNAVHEYHSLKAAKEVELGWLSKDGNSDEKIAKSSIAKKRTKDINERLKRASQAREEYLEIFGKEMP